MGWTAKKAVIAGAVIALALILTGVVLWPHPSTTRRYESDVKSLTLSMEKTSNARETASLELKLPAEAVREAKEVAALIRFKLTDETRYPGSASGEFSCDFTFSLNGTPWANDDHYGRVIQRDAQPETNWPDKTRVAHSTFESNKPHNPADSIVTAKIRHDQENVLTSSLTCQPKVTTTGPTTFTAIYGPLFALVT